MMSQGQGDAAFCAQGILLYYHYTDLKDQQQETAQWMQELCQSLGLRGRVRVARDGINATLGGGVAQLQLHIAAASSRFGPGIDFKLATNPGARNQQAQQETGFSQLSVKVCKELVTLGHLAEGRANPWTNTGVHLTPQQFHDMLLQAAQEGQDGDDAGASASPQASASQDAEACCASARSGCSDAKTREKAEMRKPTVLMDVRNMYETSIGHFSVEGVDLVDPQTRQFSDFPAFIDQHLSKLANKRVLMYCTGGVRCERASAYLREKGQEWADVFQLQGGIQRYLEAFPDGGLFKGKNFVYDERISVGAAAAAPPGQLSTSGPSPASKKTASGTTTTCLAPTSTAGAAAAATATDDGVCITQPNQGAAGCAQSNVVGRCLQCSQPWDDYGARLRCSLCRQLVLVCDSCASPSVVPSLVCSLCTKRTAKAQACRPVPGVCNGSLGLQEGSESRRLRILCLHGFRQTASNFKGRTNAFCKKLRDLAEFVFIDAPHELPLFYKPSPEEGALDHAAQQQKQPGAHQQGAQPQELCEQQEQPKQLRLPDVHARLHLHNQQQQPQKKHITCSQGDAGGVSDRTRDGQCGNINNSAEGRKFSLVPAAAHKRAWLLPPQLIKYQQQRQEQHGSQQQTQAGGPALALDQQHVSWDTWEPAPDFVTEQQHLHQTEGWQTTSEALQRAVSDLGPFDGILGFSQGAGIAAALCALQQQQQQQQPGFRFAIMASGYAPAAHGPQQLLADACPLRLPSLHLIGCSDRQVSSIESEKLATYFDAQGRTYLRHGAAHMLPATHSHVSVVRSFLQHHCQ